MHLNLFTQIDKLVATLQEEQVDVGVGSKSQLLKRNNNPRNNIGTTLTLMYIEYRTRENFGGVKFWRIATVEANGEENFGGSNGRSSVVSVSL